MYLFNNLGVLETVNTNNLADVQTLRRAQPNRPVHVTESYPGGYDNWGAKHRTQNVREFENLINDLAFKGDASFNLYMFFGGTNFGWWAASEPPKGPVETSYDYNGVLTEAGMCCPVICCQLWVIHSHYSLSSLV